MIYQKPIVMGILNLTPDSFSDGGKYRNTATALQCIESMIADGATIIDIGGESTRPNCEKIDEETEWSRIENVLQEASKFNALISIDTYKPVIAELALKNGANIINDVCTFDHLDEIVNIVKKYSAELVVTHNSRKNPFTNTHNLVENIIQEFQQAIDVAKKYNFDKQKLIFDVGLGFGKTAQQDIELLAQLKNIKSHFKQRFLIGASRKSFMHVFGENTPADRLPCTLAATFSAYLSGCEIFRVHDVKANIDVLNFAQTIYGN